MLAACLAFRNSSPYLREWLLFHLAVGFERFYLYNNDSEDDCRDVLAPFLAAGSGASPIVELIDWPGYYQQNAIYEDCLRRARPADVRWLAFIDDDEFLYPGADRELPDILNDFEAFAGVAVCWLLYGSSGQLYREDDWVIRRFTRRAAGPDQHVKCVVRPDRVVRPLVGGHLFEPQPGLVVVDEKKRPLSTALTTTPSADLLRINHYLFKSIEEWIERRTSRDIGTGDRPKRPLVDWIRDDRNWNAVADASAKKLLGRMNHLASRFPASPIRVPG